MNKFFVYASSPLIMQGEKFTILSPTAEEAYDEVKLTFDHWCAKQIDVILDELDRCHYSRYTGFTGIETLEGENHGK